MRTSRLIATGILGGGNLRYLPMGLFHEQGVIEDFESAAEWVAGSGSLADNNTEYKTGTQSLKVTSASGSSGYGDKTVNLDLSQVQNMVAAIYLHNDPAQYVTAGAITFYLANVAFSKYLQHAGTMFTLTEGWNNMALTPARFAATGGGTFAEAFTKLRVRCWAAVGQAPAASFDRWRFGTGVPAALLTFDDAYSSVYDVAFPILSARNMRATVYMGSDFIDQPGYLTAAQLAELDAAGWDIANHAKTHTNLTTLTQAQIEAELTACRDALNALGLTRASRHVAYPNAASNTTVRAAMAATNMLTGRQGGNTTFLLPDHNMHHLPCYGLSNTQTQGDLEGYADRISNYREIGMFYLHKIVPSASTALETSTALFTALVDRLLANGVQSLTISELYNATSGGISVNHK